MRIGDLKVKESVIKSKRDFMFQINGHKGPLVLQSSLFLVDIFLP